MVICFIILLTIIVQSIISLSILKHKNNELSALIDQAVDFAQKGEQEQAIEKTQEVYDYWQDYFTKVSYLIQTSKLENISYSIAKLQPLLVNNSEEFYAECSMIKLGIKGIYNSEFPHLYSVF